jgi:aminodeoxychorismate synthase component I
MTALVVHHLLEEVTLARPFWEYFEMYRHEPYSFLLDSARRTDALGEFSFLGGDPELIYEARRIPGALPADGAEITLVRRRTEAGAALNPPVVETRIADVFADLSAVCARYRVDPETLGDLPIPLIAGAVGYFAYECNYFIERLPDRGADDLALPAVCMMFVDRLLAHHHRTGRSYVSALGRGATAADAKAAASRHRDDVMKRVAEVDKDPPKAWTGPSADSKKVDVTVHAHADEDAYVRTVERAKAHIYEGDCFEICVSHRLEADFAGDPWDLYRELRRINPAPFACYLNLPEAKVVSSSPERFLSLSREGVVESRPIKGTRPRGATVEEDAALRKDLLTHPKDRAENVMIVDLVRNDLGRVCEFDSVHVPELTVVEEYATVFQLVSTVRGQLRGDRDAIDLIKAAFPGGSMTGAPKIESMKIIDELEPFKRGIWSGAIGYLDVTGAMDLNMVIRTLIVKQGRCYFSVGGAVVSDSDPLGEYTETIDKSRALVRAIEGASTQRREE